MRARWLAAFSTIRAAFATPPPEKKVDTVATVAGQWFKRDQSTNRRVGEVARIFNKDVLPVLGERPINTIRKRDIIELIDGITDRGSPIQANPTLASVKRLFRWAAGRDIIEHDPSAYIEVAMRLHVRAHAVRAAMCSQYVAVGLYTSSSLA
jgi:hypothetical protein